MINVQVEIAEADAAIRRIGQQMQFGPYFKVLGQRLLAWVNQNFREEGTEHRWQPLSPNTVAARRKGRGRGSPRLLRDTGRLAQSFTASSTDSSVTVGSSDQKALWHHAGTKPYRITAKRTPLSTHVTASGRLRRQGGQPLRFMTAQGWRSAYTVNHPGLPARPLLPSEAAALKMAHDVGTAYVQRILKQAGF